MMNTKKQIWNCGLLVLLVACWTACDSEKSNTVINKGTAEKSIDVGRIDTAAWESFSKNWVYMSRTEKSYVVYEPCDGSTPTIDIDSLRIKINSRIEELINVRMKSFQKVSESQFQTMSEDSMVSIKIRQVKPELNLWLFEWTINWPPLAGGTENYRWVMTTKENAAKFPVVKNPCPTQKIREKQFLPIEF